MQGCERQTDTRDNRSYRNLVSVLDLDNIALAPMEQIILTWIIPTMLYVLSKRCQLDPKVRVQKATRRSPQLDG